MPLSITTHPRDAATVTVTTAAKMLGITTDAANRLIDAEVLDPRPTLEQVSVLMHTPDLEVLTGELPVLRVGGKSDFRPGRVRPRLGAWASATDGELADTTLGWWRIDSERVVEAGYLLITVAYLPMVLWQIDGVADRRGGRVRFDGRLLARQVSPPAGNVSALTFHDAPDFAHTLMRSWVRTVSGGPVAYLPADTK